MCQPIRGEYLQSWPESSESINKVFRVCVGSVHVNIHHEWTLATNQRSVLFIILFQPIRSKNSPDQDTSSQQSSDCSTSQDTCPHPAEHKPGPIRGSCYDVSTNQAHLGYILIVTVNSSSHSRVSSDPVSGVHVENIANKIRLSASTNQRLV